MYRTSQDVPEPVTLALRTPKRYMLVYQAGIANVFQVTAFNLADYGRNARRVLQGSFEQCQAFARGLGEAGALVRTAACNQAGDIAGARWSEDLRDQPFADDLLLIQLGA